MSHGQDDYEEELLRLAPLLRRLAFKVKVVWWSQHPVIERYAKKTKTRSNKKKKKQKRTTVIAGNGTDRSSGLRSFFSF